MILQKGVIFMGDKSFGKAFLVLMYAFGCAFSLAAFPGPVYDIPTFLIAFISAIFGGVIFGAILGSGLIFIPLTSADKPMSPLGWVITLLAVPAYIIAFIVMLNLAH